MEHDFSSTVEGGYIWWFNFQVNSPHLVQEMGVEYHTQLVSSKDINWQTEKQLVSFTWELSMLVLTQIESQTLRWYVKDIYWNTSYTSIYWDTIVSEVPNYITYSTENTEDNSTSEDGVELNALPVALYYWVVALTNLWLKIHDWYTTVDECHSDWYVSVNCGVNLWLSLIPVWWLKKWKDVIEFSGSQKKYASSVKSYKVNGFKDLDTHYKNHWHEFHGINSASEYKRRAQSFLNDINHKDIKVWVRSRDEAIFKWDLKTWTIVNIHKDWKIGTFHINNDFKDNPQNFINKNK